MILALCHSCYTNILIGAKHFISKDEEVVDSGMDGWMDGWGSLMSLSHMQVPNRQGTNTANEVSTGPPLTDSSWCSKAVC